MKLLYVKSEHEEYKKEYTLVLVPNGYNSDTALYETIIPFPEPYVVAEYQVTPDSPLTDHLLPVYESFTAND